MAERAREDETQRGEKAIKLLRTRWLCVAEWLATSHGSNAYKLKKLVVRLEYASYTKRGSSNRNNTEQPKSKTERRVVLM